MKYIYLDHNYFDKFCITNSLVQSIYEKFKELQLLSRGIKTE